MFGNLRTSAPLYILHKQEPSVEVAEVVSVSQPTPQYQAAYNNGLITPPSMFVDVSVKVGDKTINLQRLQSDQSVADCNGMVVAENKDAIINEVAAMEKMSQSVLESVDKHQHMVDRCHELLEELNPEVRREAERTKEINELKNELGEMRSLLSQLLNTKTKKGE